MPLLDEQESDRMSVRLERLVSNFLLIQLRSHIFPEVHSPKAKAVRKAIAYILRQFGEFNLSVLINAFDSF